MTFYCREFRHQDIERISKPKQLIMSRLSGIGSLSRQIVLIMKLSIFLLAIALQVSAIGTTAQKTISYQGKDVNLEQVFASVKKQTGYTFIYYADVLQGTHKVTLDVKNLPIEQFLDVCLKDEPIMYKIIGETILIKKKEIGIINESDPESPAQEIKGRVINKQGEPLSNANVMVKNSKQSTITDANGQFILKNVHEEDILSVSYVGYKLQSTKIGNRKFIPFTLEDANSELDETVVQAYGITSRRLATGDISKVSSAEIEKQPIMNPLQALQGRVPGLVITQTNGYASAPWKIEIQGRNSIDPKMPSDPLFIIDGVPLTIVEVNLTRGSNINGTIGFLQNGMGGPANGQSPFFNINPADIESIEVLKDADATSIYGSRGANGVILITTKKAKIGKTSLDVHFNQGVSKVTRFWDMLNTKQYLAMRREAFKNSGQTMTTGNAPDLLVWDTTRYTDWQKVLWGGTGKFSSIQLGLSGGNNNTSFRISTAYNRLTDILAVSGANQRASLSFALNHHSVDRKFNLSFTNAYSLTQSNMINLPTNEITLPPDAPPIYNTSGNLNYSGWVPVAFPFANLLQPYTAKTDLLNSNLTLGYEVIKGGTIKTSFGYNVARNTQQFLTPISSLNPLNQPTGVAAFGNNSNKNWIIEPQVEYNAFIGDGKLNILIGGSAQGTVTDGQTVSGSGYTSDALLRTISNAPTQSATDNYGTYRYVAVFARINYNWGNKYIVNMTARRDGSSKFGEDNQFGNFGSIGAAWVFTEENWLKHHFTFLSFGKLRGSYGITGSEGPAYGYLTRFSSVNPPYANIISLVPTQHANPDYHWQLNRKLEGAVDLAFLQDRLNVSLTYYQNRCNNQLVAFPLPFQTGFSSVIANSPASVQNTGWEMSGSEKLLDKKIFKWYLNFTVSINRNKLLAYPNIEKSPYYGNLIVGQSLNIRRALHYTGVDPQTGLYTFQDKNKDGMIDAGLVTPTSDLYSYDLNPRFTGGLGTGVTYRNVDLSIFFTFMKQKGTNAYANLQPGVMKNMPLGVLDRWQKPGDIASFARYTTAPGTTDIQFSSQSDGSFTDASFIRLQNISLSYRLSPGVLSKAKIQGMNIFINAQNLLTITKYKGIDPETQNFGGLPPAKTITGGLSFNF